MAGRTAFFGEWTTVNRGFFICMLGANLLVNVWTIVTSAGFASVLAGDFALVTVLLAVAVAVRPAQAEATTAPAHTPPTPP
jgi:hypothetical protein